MTLNDLYVRRVKYGVFVPADLKSGIHFAIYNDPEALGLFPEAYFDRKMVTEMTYENP